MNPNSQPHLTVSPHQAWEPVLPRVQRPGRYLGAEINAVIKDPAQVRLRAVLLFPDLCEIGKSYLGLEILYQILNAREDIWAERAFVPALDCEAELRRQHLPLVSLESGTPLARFDLLGISLQYELGYTNVLTLLELGGIPWLAAARRPQDPVVIGGGPGCFNAEPVAPFFDALVLGDGEEVILEVAAVIESWRAAGADRQALWQALEAIDGVYVPALFEVAYDGQGVIQAIIPRGVRPHVQRRLVPDLNRLPHLARPLVPNLQIVHDRLNVEIARGCTRGCRFCQAGILYRPVREKDPQAILNWVEEALAATGFEEISLLSLSTGDYGCLQPLLTTLMNRLEARRIAVSLPSLRADTLTTALMDEIRRVRKTGFTIAPEAGSERLRAMINKNLSDSEILAAIRQAFALGWNLIKLYFIIGFPMETAADLESIAHLSQAALAASHGGSRPAHLHVSLNGFIPKPHTPLQWERQLSLGEMRERLHRVKNLVARKRIEIKWNPADQSWLEGIFARGDRRLAPVLMAAHRLGCRLDAWTEHLHLNLWQQAFQECGVDPDAYLRERPETEVLPWDHLHTGVSRDFLLQERRRSRDGTSTSDCRQGLCQDCGVCDHTRIQPHVLSDCTLTPPPSQAPRPGNGSFHYRLHYTKLDQASWFSHLELMTIIHRSLRRTGLPLAYTQGYHPLPKVSFYGALPVGLVSLAETMDVELTRPVDTQTLVASLNLHLPTGLQVMTATAYPKKPRPPVFQRHQYAVSHPEEVFTPQAVAAFQERRPFLVERRKPKEIRQIDLHDLVAALTRVDGCHLELTLHLRERDNLKAYDVVRAIFALTDDQAQAQRLTKLATT